LLSHTGINQLDHALQETFADSWNGIVTIDTQLT